MNNGIQLNNKTPFETGISSSKKKKIIRMSFQIFHFLSSAEDKIENVKTVFHTLCNSSEQGLKLQKEEKTSRAIHSEYVFEFNNVRQRALK